MFAKKLLSGAALAALSLSMGGVAHAQSTASQIQEDEPIVVHGARRTIDGAISAETGAKARSTITQDFIEHQTPGQTILDQISLIPGVVFSNNDAYGTSGGELNIRGFDSARISLTFDGIQLNDTGNYAIYSNQQLDPELIARANVNQGSTDVDSPTASATGGTVNYVTRRPSDHFGLMLRPSIGTDQYYRVFALLDTGEVGPWGTTMFGAISDETYDQFVGPGSLQKRQYNYRIYQPLSGSDFVSLAVHYNENRNDFYRRISLTQYRDHQGNDIVYDATCTYTVNECSNYRGVNINPSNTGNVRVQSQFSLGEHLTLTVDPSYQYVLADGGGTFTFSETDSRLIGNAGGGVASLSTNSHCGVITGPQGVDLNGDCDTNDASVRVYEPNITNTHRFMVLSSLIWDIDPNNSLRVGFTWDHGNHRQTGEMTTLNSHGDPENVFGGKDGYGAAIPTLDDSILRRRDRSSIAELSQWNVEYRGSFLDDALGVTVGVRAPQFTRDLHNRCWTQPGNSNPWCTTNDASVPAIYSIAPFTKTVRYDDVLPNVGVTYRLAPEHQLFFNYAENLSAPRTDDLYVLSLDGVNAIRPETSTSYDFGYRYRGERLLAAATGWYSQFHNRIERAYDQDTGTSFSENIGDVNLWGADFEAGFQPMEGLTFIASLSYKDSEILSDIPKGAGTFYATRGRQLYNQPDWTLGGRAQYEIGPLEFGLQSRYVSERWANLTNTERAPAYAVFDADFRWEIGTVGDAAAASYFQLNVTNLFDRNYLGTISTPTALDGTGLYNLGAPRTIMATVGLQF